MSETTDFLYSLIQEQPKSVDLLCHYARALLDEGQLAMAIQAASDAVRWDNSFVEAWLVRAEALQALGRWAQAANDFENAARLAPCRASILISIAGCCAELSYLEDAAQWLRRAIEIEPRNKEAQANLGSILVRLERLDEAELPCQTALALDKDMISAHQNLSVILARRDKHAARSHRHSAYQQQQVFTKPALREQHSVLVLVAADAGNIPLRHLLPRCDFTVIRWYIEYAPFGQFKHLPRFELAFNSIGDADFIPRIGGDAAQHLQALEGKMLNPLDRVTRTARHRLPCLLSGIPGVVVPSTSRVEAGCAVGKAGCPADLRSPVLIRPLGSHGGAGLRLTTLGAADENTNTTHYRTEFVDYQATDGFYRKYRVIFVNGEAFAYHLAISPCWLVHYWTAGMERDPGRRAEEKEFLTDPAGVIGGTAWTAVKTIGQRLGLDYSGVDFTVLQDGRILVFEANATMLVHPEPDPMFAYRRDAVAAIQQAFSRMICERCSDAGRPD